MNTSSAHCSAEGRRKAEGRARFALLELLCTVSVLRTALTRVLPLAGSATWWVTLAALLPGAGLFLLVQGFMRRTGASTLTELVRRRLGRPGLWVLCSLLGLLLLLDAAATLTALTAFFLEGVGTRGTPLTLSLLTAAALLPCLHRDGLPRAVYLLRWALLAAAVIAGAVLLPQCRAERLHPLLGSGSASVRSALAAGCSLGWPLLLLLTIPAEGQRTPTTSLARVILGTLAPLLLACLLLPHEVLRTQSGLSSVLLLPGRYAPSGVRLLLHCLLLLACFFSVGGALHTGAELAGAPLSRPLRWLPHAALALLPLTQLLRRDVLFSALEEVNTWALLPAGAFVLLLIIPARRRRL